MNNEEDRTGRRHGDQHSEEISQQVQSGLQPLVELISEQIQRIDRMDRKIDDYHLEARGIAAQMMKDYEKFVAMNEAFDTMVKGKKIAWFVLRTFLWIFGFIIACLTAIKLIRDFK